MPESMAAILGPPRFPNDQNLVKLLIVGLTKDLVLIAPPENPDLDFTWPIAFPRDDILPLVDSLEVGRKISARVTKGGEMFEPIPHPPPTEVDQIY
jgi:hypothetical protein